MRMNMGSVLKTFAKKPAAKPEKMIRRGDREAVVISVAAQKGGVGKTTTSLTLAAAMARFHGKKVCLIDLDPQGHCNLALREQVELGGGAVSEVLTENTNMEIEEVVTATAIDGLFITPADPQLVGAEDRMASRIGKEMVLKKAIEITRSHYDVILIDCPPNLGTLTVNALVASDYVLVPANPAALGLAGVMGIMSTIDEVRALNVELRVAGVVLTRMDGRNKSTNQAVLELCEEQWGEAVFDSRIGINDALSQAQLAGQDIYAYDPGSRGAAQYKALAIELLERCGI